MGRLWIVSDTHFGHANIINYANRPFDSLEEMNDELIRRWNERVKPADSVIHLGDFCFKNSAGGKSGEGDLKDSEYYLKQLNGRVTILEGNHDAHNSVRSHIKSIVLDYGRKNIFCVHNPVDANFEYELNLVGHVHRNWKIKEYDDAEKTGKRGWIINCGVDIWDFRPITVEEIFALVAQKERKYDKPTIEKTL